MSALTRFALVALLAVPVHAHQEGPGAHSAEKHDIVALALFEAVEENFHLCAWEAAQSTKLIEHRRKSVSKAIQAGDDDVALAILHAFDIELSKICFFGFD